MIFVCRLGRKVVGLVAHDLHQNLVLPVLQRRVLEQERQHVTLRLLGELLLVCAFFVQLIRAAWLERTRAGS
jgi:predicted outer membrane lipoprotein